ncbi:hypothetical protein [Fischerella sp. JS2]|uniref:hypothetical protein n=1 Tax=Fischerella sp. JS2 TaxID=2597771 RepID=UPI0028E8C060|nr:hypothetical protein [Fischerella sp. JS2]
MESKNTNKAKQKQSFSFLTVLSLCAIITSTTTAVIEKESNKQNLAPAGEQQSLSQDSISSLNESNSAVLEEINLDKEWESISSEKSEQGFLILAGSEGF